MLRSAVRSWWGTCRVQYTRHWTAFSRVVFVRAALRTPPRPRAVSPAWTDQAQRGGAPKSDVGARLRHVPRWLLGGCA
eukprot:4571520-Prymnesium_polylepis.1